MGRKTSYFGGGGGGGGGLVSSVFGRAGAVAAVLGDYTSSLISNTSGVAGATVTAALNTLAAAIAAIPAAPVSSVFGRTGAVIAVLNDYTSSLVQNLSGVTGATVTAALNTLATITPTPIKTDATPRNTTQTLVVSNGNRVLITALASDITLTLGVTGAGANEGFIIERRDTSAFQVTVINGGPAGAGGPVGGANLYVFPGSVQRSSSFIFDAADWSQGINLAIVYP